MANEKYNSRVPLGTGSFSRVYRAYNPELDRYVVLKSIPFKGASHRMLAEARLQASSRVKSIPEIYEVMKEKGHAVLVMEWIKGLSFSQFFTQYLPTAEELLDIAGLASDALEDLHRHNMFHGDLNMHNILCTLEGNVSVIDFGFSASRQSGTGQNRGGTPVYTAPEILDGSGKVSVSADIYSLGAVLLELFYHLTPEQAKKAEENFSNGSKSPDAVFSSNLHKSIWPVLLRCISATPERRFNSAGELSAALKGMAFQGSGNWLETLELHYGAFLSTRLTETAKQFLKKEKNSTAFTLLKEAVKWAPDNTEALGMLEKADFSASHRLHWRFAAGALTAGLALIAIVYLSLSKKRPDTTVPLPEKDLTTRMAAQIQGKEVMRGKPGGPLKVAMPGNPAGSLVLTGFESGLRVLVDDSIVGFNGGALSLAPGPHRVIAYRDGKPVVEKTIEIKPFQKLILDYSTLKEAND